MRPGLRLPLKLAAWLVTGVAALLVLLAVAVALFDWNRAKPWIVAQAEHVVARRVQIDGDLALSWSTGLDTEAATTRWLPRLHLRASQVVIGNPTWATSDPVLARAAAVDMRFSPLSLLRRHWRISEMQLQQPELTMERAADGRKAWRFTQSAQSRWSVDIGRLVFDQLRLRYVDRPLDLDLAFQIAPLAPPPQQPQQARYAVAATISGRWHQAPVTAQGQGGALLDLLNDGAVFPIQARGRAGQVDAVIEGSFTNPHQLVRADLQLTLAGSSFADLYASTGVPLPNTRAFKVQGLLAIVRDTTRDTVWDWHYQRFSGTVGESDYAGDAHFIKGLPRPQLQATVQSRQLRLADLTGAHSQKRPGRLLPDQAVQPQRWNGLDAQVDISAQSFSLTTGMDWQQAHTRIVLKDQLLTADPLQFSMAAGRGQGKLVLDARQDPLHSRISLSAQGLPLQSVLPGLAGKDARLGHLDGNASLEGRGNSIADTLATADGYLNAAVSAGTMSQFMLEAAGLNLANAVFAKLYHDKQVALHCAVAALRVEHGRVLVKQFMINTEDAVIDVSGQADLAQESLALDVTPRNKRLRIFSLTSPLTVAGTFAAPRLGAHQGKLVGRAAAAGALALVAPVAAVIPLISPAEQLPDTCPPLAGQ